jgi:hypothetical protein
MSAKVIGMILPWTDKDWNHRLTGVDLPGTLAQAMMFHLEDVVPVEHGGAMDDAEGGRFCDTPQRAADYWRLHAERNVHFYLERECSAVPLILAPTRGRCLLRSYEPACSESFTMRFPLARLSHPSRNNAQTEPTLNKSIAGWYPLLRGATKGHKSHMKRIQFKAPPRRARRQCMRYRPFSSAVAHSNRRK